MRFRPTVLLAVLLGVAGTLSTRGGTARAARFESMYSAAELEQAAANYRPNLRGVWLEDLGNELTPAERRAAACASLHLPLRGQNNHPFDFYANTATGEVTVPIRAVKFFDDLAIAVAWLESQGCDTLSAFDYVSMMRYQSPASLPGGRFPTPRQVLGLPRNVLSNAFVVDVSQKTLKSTVYFLMAHELAHVMYEHAGYESISATVAQRQEIEAEQFALQVMRRIAVPPAGLAVFFAAVSRVDPEQTRTHPLSSDRLGMVATYIRENAGAFTRVQRDPGSWLPRIQDMAREIDRLARLLDDPDVRALQRRNGSGKTFASLQSSCSA